MRHCCRGTYAEGRLKGRLGRCEVTIERNCLVPAFLDLKARSDCSTQLCVCSLEPTNRWYGASQGEGVTEADVESFNTYLIEPEDSRAPKAWINGP